MTIAFEDESKLTWFFGVGATAFERSTVGSMLEHAELFGNSHVGYVDGELLYERLPRAASPWGRVQDGAIVYSGCEVTARPTAETRTASGYAPSLRDMETYAWVSGVLRGVERRSGLAVAALECWYGDCGHDWARTPKPGRLGSLYHLTSAGVRLLHDSAAEALKRGQPVEASPARRMQNESARKDKPERVRVRLLQAERQALLLRAEAFAAWCVARAERERGRAA